MTQVEKATGQDLDQVFAILNLPHLPAAGLGERLDTVLM